MRKITCPSCHQKHQTRGYPIVCVKCQITLCPTCGYEIGGEEHDNLGRSLYSGEGCQVCGWKPEEEEN